MKNKIPHIKTVLKSYEIVDTENKNQYPEHTDTWLLPFPSLCMHFSQNWWCKVNLMAQTASLSEILGLCNCFPRVSSILTRAYNWVSSVTNPFTQLGEHTNPCIQLGWAYQPVHTTRWAALPTRAYNWVSSVTNPWTQLGMHLYQPMHTTGWATLPTRAYNWVSSVTNPCK
jgi:hypothetical protein